jgi:peptidoglycan L-alanyl-D-glutamate endopeptidase CwlK
MITLTQKDKDKLKGVHPDLVRVVNRLARETNLPFQIGEGLRSWVRQKMLVATGKSKTMNSRHLTGHAVDIFPLVNGKPSWDWKYYYPLAKEIKRVAALENVPLEWGGDWRTFKDGPHWQLPFSKYPKK